MIRTQIQLTEQQAHALKALSQAQGVSIADLIRRGVLRRRGRRRHLLLHLWRRSTSSITRAERRWDGYRAKIRSLLVCIRSGDRKFDGCDAERNCADDHRAMSNDGDREKTEPPTNSLGPGLNDRSLEHGASLHHVRLR